MKPWFIMKIWQFFADPPGKDVRDILAKLPTDMHLFNASSVISSADRELLFDSLLIRFGASITRLPGVKSVVFVNSDPPPDEVKHAFETIYAQFSKGKIEW